MFPGRSYGVVHKWTPQSVLHRNSRAGWVKYAHLFFLLCLHCVRVLLVLIEMWNISLHCVRVLLVLIEMWNIMWVCGTDDVKHQAGLWYWWCETLCGSVVLMMWNVLWVCGTDSVKHVGLWYWWSVMLCGSVWNVWVCGTDDVQHCVGLRYWQCEVLCGSVVMMSVRLDGCWAIRLSVVMMSVRHGCWAIRLCGNDEC